MGALVLDAAMRDGKTPIASKNRIVVPGDLTILENLKRAGLIAVYEKAGFRVDPPAARCVSASPASARARAKCGSRRRTGTSRTAWAGLARVARLGGNRRGVVVRHVDHRSSLAAREGRPGSLRLRAPSRDAEGSRRPRARAAARARGVRSRQDGSRGGDRVGCLPRRVQRFGTTSTPTRSFPRVSATSPISASSARTRSSTCARSSAARERRTRHRRRRIGWGSGSSREQACSALKGAGIRVVIAKTYAFIHKRNLVNEAVPYLVVRDEAFYALAGEDANWRSTSPAARSPTCRAASLRRRDADADGSGAPGGRWARARDPEAWPKVFEALT